MAVNVIVEFQAKPEAASQFKDVLIEALPDTRAYDGCQGLEEYHNVDEDGNIVLVEKWESRQHYEKYIAWRTESGLLDKVSEMLAREPSIRYYEKVS